MTTSAAKHWFEVWYYNPRDNSRATRVDARRRSEKTARALANDLMAKEMAFRPNGAWLVLKLRPA